jgi:hypothetical protein
MPYKNIENCIYAIKGCAYWMLREKAEDISKIINEELKKVIVDLTERSTGK